MEKLELDDKQKLLFEFVKFHHEGQVRKYTGEPYHNHLLSVATIASEHIEGAIEIA